MVAFWQENILNNRSHVALAGKALSGVVAVDCRNLSTSFKMLTSKGSKCYNLSCYKSRKSEE